MGLLLWLTPNRSRSTTQTNIALCFPELSKQAQQKLVFHSLQHTGMLAFEVAAIWHRPYSWLEQKILSIENLALFEQAQEQKNGVIVLSPHVGNWEIFSRYIPTKCDAIALYEPPQHPELEKLIKRGREKTGLKLAPTSTRGIASLLKHLKRGGTSCILPDQVPSLKDRSGVFAPFFGKPAYTMTLVKQLHQRTGAVIIGTAAKRVKGGFKIIFYRPEDAIYDKDDIVSTSAMNKLVERCARDMPAQYQWEYKRFRRAPKGERKIY